MSWYDPALIQQIKKQSANKQIEASLLMGSYYESSMGTDASAWNPAGLYDPDQSGNAGYSYGPFFFRTPGALDDVMTQYGLTQAAAANYVTTPVGAVNTAIKIRYKPEYDALGQGVWTSGMARGSMEVANAAEVGVGEQNALSSGSYVGTYNTYVAPIMQQGGVKGQAPPPPSKKIVNPPSPDPNTVAKGDGSFTNALESIMAPKVSGWSWLNPGDWGKNIGSYMTMVIVRTLIAGAGLLMMYFGFMLIVQKSGIISTIEGGGGEGGQPMIIPV